MQTKKPEVQAQRDRASQPSQVKSSKVKVFIVAYTKFLQRSEILMTWQPTSTQSSLSSVCLSPPPTLCSTSININRDRDRDRDSPPNTYTIAVCVCECVCMYGERIR